MTNKRARNTVKISFHCLCSDFPFIAKTQHPFPAVNVMHTIALLSVWKPSLTRRGGIKDQITSSVCKTVQSKTSPTQAVQNRLIRQRYILRLHCLPASNVFFFIWTVFTCLGTKSDNGPYLTKSRQHLKGGLQTRDLTTYSLHVGDLWLSEHKDIAGLLVLTRLGADSFPDAMFQQEGLWLYLTICMRGCKWRSYRTTERRASQVPVQGSVEK